MAFARRNTSMAVKCEGKLERTERWEYPPDADREAITNALCHRDYAASKQRRGGADLRPSVGGIKCGWFAGWDAPELPPSGNVDPSQCTSGGLTDPQRRGALEHTVYGCGPWLSAYQWPRSEARGRGPVVAAGLRQHHYDYEGKVELYNIAEDISEKKNLARTQPKLTLDMLAELTDWLRTNCNSAYLPKANPAFEPSGPLPYGPYVPLEQLRASLFDETQEDRDN